MYKIEEAFNNMLDDLVVEMVGGSVALGGSLQVQPCTSSEPMRGWAASRTTGDVAVSAEHLIIGIRSAEVETSEESGEPGGLDWSLLF